MNNQPIMQLFKENELNIASLYSLYAQKIPDKEVFWNKLSNEELSHAANIGNEAGSDDGIIENKFSRGVIKYVMDFVLAEIERAQKENVTHRDALTSALRIERSMLEKKCFEMFMPTKETLKSVLLKTNRETEHHVELLMQEVKKNKFKL